MAVATSFIARYARRICAAALKRLKTGFKGTSSNPSRSSSNLTRKHTLSSYKTTAVPLADEATMASITRCAASAERPDAAG